MGRETGTMSINETRSRVAVVSPAAGVGGGGGGERGRRGPMPPGGPDDPVMPMAQDETNTLNSTAKGKDFDKAYIDDEVKAHKAVLDLATKGASQTQNTELKNLIQKAAPVIQGHLTKAESIQKSLK